jgi:hypothetical protein
VLVVHHGSVPLAVNVIFVDSIPVLLRLFAVGAILFHTQTLAFVHDHQLNCVSYILALLTNVHESVIVSTLVILHVSKKVSHVDQLYQTYVRAFHVSNHVPANVIELFSFTGQLLVMLVFTGHVLVHVNVPVAHVDRFHKLSRAL